MTPRGNRGVNFPWRFGVMAVHLYLAFPHRAANLPVHVGSFTENLHGRPERLPPIRRRGQPPLALLQISPPTRPRYPPRRPRPHPPRSPRFISQRPRPHSLLPGTKNRPPPLEHRLKIPRQDRRPDLRRRPPSLQPTLSAKNRPPAHRRA